MEALLAAQLPDGKGWQFEPKWDGFRCLAKREGDDVQLISKSGKPLGRYFPEMLEVLGGLKQNRFLLDGELIISVSDVLSFDALQLRLHPAESRVRKLAKESPAELMLFDLLSLGGKDLSDEPLSERRAALEKFHAYSVAANTFHRDDQVSGGKCVAMHFGRVGEARETDLRNVLARKPVLDQRPNRIAVAEARIEITHGCASGGRACR